ncbi:NAD(P)-dependent alcohol dehydrogenase [Nocardioides montaniterrae]
MRTTAYVVETPGGPFVEAEIELDEPREDEVLVRVVATGLCHTDLTVPQMLPAEMMPVVVGHEGAGVVEAVGSAVTGIVVGDHVVLSFRSCRDCDACRAGDVGYCDQTLLLNYMGMRADGSSTMSRDGERVGGSFFGQSSFARHALAYADNCVVVDKELDLTRLGPYGCGFQTGAGTVLNVVLGGGTPAPGLSLVVFGAGAVGLAAIAAARGAGIGTVVAVDPVASRRSLAEEYGAIALDPSQGDSPIQERVKQATGGGAAYAIDTTAISAVVLQAQRSLRPQGTLIALGLGAPTYEIDAIELLQKGLTIRSSIEGEGDPLTMIPDLLARAADGRLDVDRLVTTYPFDQIAQAVADSGSGKVVKPVLVWD